MGDVSASTVTADGAVYAARTRVKKIAWVNAASAGVIVLKDGGTGGTALITLNTSAIAGYADLDIPSDGVLFETNVYCDLTNCTSVTVFYG
jgi:hypothetical protein